MKALEARTNAELSAVILRLEERVARHNRLKKLRQICNYLEKNRDRIRYDEYLAAGYPIASGSIEGACR